MNMYPEIEAIAKANQLIATKVESLKDQLEDDLDGVDFRKACVITNCIVVGETLFDSHKKSLGSNEDDQYFCDQDSGGYSGDDFHGTLYFKMRDGDYLAAPFWC